jgi:hypothetical protein
MDLEVIDLAALRTLSVLSVCIKALEIMFWIVHLFSLSLGMRLACSMSCTKSISCGEESAERVIFPVGDDEEELLEDSDALLGFARG